MVTRLLPVRLIAFTVSKCTDVFKHLKTNTKQQTLKKWDIIPPNSNRLFLYLFFHFLSLL